MTDLNSLGLLIPVFAGILVSFTPCVAVLFPITFYRFMSDAGTDYKAYFLYALGFLFTFTIAGFLFQQLFESSIQNGIKLTIAIALIMLGTLQFFNRVNPLNLPVIKNTFVFGAIFAVAIGINPCAVPFTGQVFALSSGGEIFINLFLFGIGILIAPTLLLIFGNELISHSRKITEKMHYIDKPISVLLAASGIYMGLHILELTQLDLILSSILILILLLVILKIFFIGNSIKNLLTLPRILLVASVFVMWFVITYHCYGMVSPGGDEAVCSMTCFVCQRCLVLFGVSVILGVAGSLLLEWYENKNNKNNNSKQKQL